MIKHLTAFERGSGAKVDYDKTKGLWGGAWKQRTDTSLNIKWTSKNVKNLGVFFGNDGPAWATFQKLLPKVIHGLL